MLLLLILIVWNLFLWTDWTRQEDYSIPNKIVHSVIFLCFFKPLKQHDKKRDFAVKQSFCVWRGKKRLWRQICYKKAEKRKRICCVKRNLVGRTHRLIFKTSSSNTTTILDPNCYIFCAPIVPLCKLEIFTVKALHSVIYLGGYPLPQNGTFYMCKQWKFLFLFLDFILLLW